MNLQRRDVRFIDRDVEFRVDRNALDPEQQVGVGGREPEAALARDIELTAQGKLYLPHLIAGFAELSKAHDQLELSKRSSHLLISTYPSLATKWLGTLMFAWKKQHPAASATVSGVHPEPALEAGEADFRISYGNRHRFHSRYTYLFTGRLVVVASPRTAGARRDEWFASAGVEVRKLRQDLVFSFPAPAVDAAIETQGFALAQHSVVASALALGTLVHVLPPELPLPEAHFLAWGGAALEKPMGAAFHSW